MTSKLSDKALIQRLLEGSDIEINGSRPWDIQINDERTYRRILQQGSIGFGESYMDGWWNCNALEQLFARLLRAKLDQKINANFKLCAQMAFKKMLYFFYNPQSERRAFIVGKQHYDIGNDLYSRMLDPETMSYTCGYWKDSNTLQAAQLAKLDLVCQKLQLEPGMRLLDIGCGFGGLAKYAATHYNVEVVGLTISKEQQRLAQERCKSLTVDIRFQDYRDLKEKFDRVVSIGMFEHVGYKNYDCYMDVVSSSLKSDEDIFLLHTIGGNFSTLEADPWIAKYIFPNGVLPSIAQIGTSIEKKFVMEDWHNFGFDYYQTLMAWHENFVASYPELKDKYNQRFFRMWTYYLLSCAGAFYARDIQLWQVVLSKSGVQGPYTAPR